MKTISISAAILAIAFGSASATAFAQKSDFGKREYDGNCAVCHGKLGKGDGPYVGIIDTRIADLAGLSKRNVGVFPFQRVYEVIDGRQLVKAHGPRDMPIWGDRYRVAAAEYYVDVPYEPEAFVRTRILALTEYVNRLQAK